MTDFTHKGGKRNFRYDPNHRLEPLTRCGIPQVEYAAKEFLAAETRRRRWAKEALSDHPSEKAHRGYARAARDAEPRYFRLADAYDFQFGAVERFLVSEGLDPADFRQALALTYKLGSEVRQ